MKRATTISLVCLLLACLPSQAGLFSDDPLELSAKPVPRLLADDELHFQLAGKCSGFMLYQPELTLELVYSTGTQKLNCSTELWAFDKPLVVKLPNGLKNLQSYRLTGKVRQITKFKAKMKRTGDSKRDFVENQEPVTGYKKTIDAKWIVGP
ncbi:hypothetical protein NXS98_06120 [Fontisphaera persica]|uniref:hypothetical protein n=1 Tax=Fontisphaera persica TaxID=2974023 RepID=UPI0024C09349|nr:hypothetical protein [Fontisphaera persica]WCJ60700.1 hypothetical protein NXS98_06120 [Fontisphaera persica]